MADYVSREVARDRLHGTCKAGRIFAVLLLLLGLGYGAVVAIIITNVAVPKVVLDILYKVAPTLNDQRLAIGDFSAKAILLLLISIVSIVMFSKISRSGDAFRLGQLKQLKFIAFLVFLLGFVPPLAGNGVRVYDAIQAGESPLSVIHVSLDVMCIVGGLLLFLATRVLTAGANLGTEEELLYASDPIADDREPDFVDVPDLANVPTAAPLTPDAYDMDQTMQR
jgi:hypothetical protein